MRLINFSVLGRMDMSTTNNVDEPGKLTPFLKQLASTGRANPISGLSKERPIREKALESLHRFLSQDRSFTELDFLKLWKGLYYCMWMCDRMRVQQQLADN